MDLKLLFFVALLYTYHQFEKCNTEKITYISTEHPIVTYYDKTYIKNMDFYFYQFLTNGYRPSFVEMHFKFCDLITKDVFFGTAIRNALGNRSCPFLPGEYDLRDMYIHYVPKGFPFVKGRIYLNASIVQGGVIKILARGSIDMEVKVGEIKDKPQAKSIV